MTDTLTDYGCYVTEEDDGHQALYLRVEGMRCAACAWKVESTLNAYDGVNARMTYATQRLKLVWDKSAFSTRANDLAAAVEALGFSVAPFDVSKSSEGAKAEESLLLRCLAVAGFATTFVMLFADALWFSPDASLNGATRDLMHWAMALVALPTTLYAGRPFFRSAIAALRHGRSHMDVPISVAVLLTAGMSLFETMRHGPHVYFDASVMLLFFLLIGRYLDLKARGKAREAAEGLLAMLDGTASVREGGQVRSCKISDLRPGMTLVVAAGEKIAADATLTRGTTEVDTSLLTGETLPRAVSPGETVYAGTINVAAPLEAVVTAASENSLLSRTVALMETAEQGQARFVHIADRVAAIYAPVVHIVAALTFAGWALWGHGGWQDALLKAMAVLIVTCPCALGLAVPVAQVLASGQLFRRGILLKSARGLERLAAADTVIFDKTGTLTRGQPTWMNPQALNEYETRLAVALAAQSRHPLSRALVQARPDLPVAPATVEDVPGCGLRGEVEGEPVWLGKATWLGIESAGDSAPELWFRRGSHTPVRLVFEDTLRLDARLTIDALKARGLDIWLLSGDRRVAAERVATELGIDTCHADLSPLEKLATVQRLQAEGRKVLMVGDGLNDAAALSAASVSISPASGMDITQNAADLVFRGDSLWPVAEALRVAERTGRIVTQNFVLSFGYNLIAVPLAVGGGVTPLIAAIAMSASSLVVVANAFRLKLPGRIA
ncbi:cadmium-translocating P-type ATPase [Asticcacaulis sp. DW145]|uniref:heavy metal translocating P-type ATPase n=1 Tax=unclassified Asticcacaulis TaxID=2628350 RepID=UPI0030921355|nr:cadmium-translocating P-type ATPase [Asticcacaulis sp. DW145]